MDVYVGILLIMLNPNEGLELFFSFCYCMQSISCVGKQIAATNEPSSLLVKYASTKIDDV